VSARARVALLALCIGTLAVGRVAVVRAHAGHDVLRAERYIKFEATDTGLRVVVSLSLGTEEMLRIARIADEDQDGSVTERESQRYLEEWGETLRRELPMRVDGSFVRVPWAAPYFDPLGRISARSGTVEVSGVVHMVPGRHFIVVTDQMRFDSFERTDVTFAARDGGVLINSGPNDAPTELVETFAYGRNADIPRVRVIGLTIELPQPEVAELPKARARGTWLPFAVVPTVSIFAVLFARLAREAKERRRR
jgi:hypothetical protein